MQARNKESLIGVTLLLFGLGVWFYASYGISAGSAGTTLGPAFFPKFLSVSLMTLSALLIVRAHIGSKDLPETQDSNTTSEPSNNASLEDGKIVNSALIFSIMFFYVFVVESLGYVITTLVSMTAMMWILSVRKWYLYLMLIGFVFLTQYIFETVMYIRLP